MEGRDKGEPACVSVEDGPIGFNCRISDGRRKEVSLNPGCFELANRSLGILVINWSDVSSQVL